MDSTLLVDLAPWAATLVSLFVAWLAHKRAVAARQDRRDGARPRRPQHAVRHRTTDRAEIDRLRRELVEEREKRARLEERVEALTVELDKVEKRNGFYNERKEE